MHSLIKYGGINRHVNFPSLEANIIFNILNLTDHIKDYQKLKGKMFLLEVSSLWSLPCRDKELDITFKPRSQSFDQVTNPIQNTSKRRTFSHSTAELEASRKEFINSCYVHDSITNLVKRESLTISVDEGIGSSGSGDSIDSCKRKVKISLNTVQSLI